MGEAVEDSGVWTFLVGSLRRFLREFSPGLEREGANSVA
jgi:hypothetical protein